MSDGRPWYREPETFVAVAALIVSLTAVVVGIYEAWLQRAHDRAEVWPRLEISTWYSDSGVRVSLVNTGLGPGLVKSIEVDVDGKPRRSWDDILTAVYGHAPPPHSTGSVSEHALRPGDATVMVGLRRQDLPPNFADLAARIVIRICYASVFGDSWTVTGTPGKNDTWNEVRSCPAQRDSTDL